MSITAEQFAVVLALAKCGIAMENPSHAYIHQMRRLVKVLPQEQGEKIQSALDWHDSGRANSDQKVAMNDVPLSNDLNNGEVIVSSN